MAPADLKQRYPAFSGVSDDRVQEALSDALEDVPEDPQWLDGDRDRAVLCLAAHMLAKEDALGDGSKSAEAKPVSSAKLGDASESYALSQEYGSTRYGQRFLELRERAFRTALVI